MKFPLSAMLVVAMVGLGGQPRCAEAARRQSLDVYGPAYQPQVEVVIPGFHPKGYVELADGVVRFNLVSQGDADVDVQLSIDVQAHGTFLSFDQGTRALGAAGTSRVEIPVAALGIAPDDLETPAILTFRALTKDAAGNDVDGVVSPAYYLHRDRRRGVLLYSEKKLKRFARGGDLTGAFLDELGKDQFPNQIKIHAGPGDGNLDPWAEPPLSSGDQTICIHWNYQSRDHNAGERYYKNGEPMAARGVKLTVYQGGGGPSGQTLFAHRETGCVSVPLAGGSAKVTVSAEARLGVNDNIRVRTYESQALSDKKVTPGSDHLKKWVFNIVTGPNPIHLYVPVGVSSTLMALGTFAIHRLDQLDPLTEDVEARLVYRHELNNSDADDTDVRVARPQGDRKFMYGHELGHWYAKNKGIEFEGPYFWKGKSPACWSLGAPSDPAWLWHLLRSTEYNTPAFNEGLAHFLSTLVWNGLSWPAPRFRYYKNMKAYADQEGFYGDLHEAFNLVDMAASTDALGTLGGRRNWRDNVCTDDNPQNYSVQLDWARFLLNYLDGETWSNPAGSPPTFAQLLAQLRLAYDEYYVPETQQDDSQAPYATYFFLLSALNDPDLGQQQFITRWETLAATYGVDWFAPVK